MAHGALFSDATAVLPGRRRGVGASVRPKARGRLETSSLRHQRSAECDLEEEPERRALAEGVRSSPQICSLGTETCATARCWGLVKIDACS